MPQPRIGALAICGFLGLLTIAGGAQERPTIPDKYKWNITDVYPSVAAWRAAKDTVTADAAAVVRFKGRLLSSASTLADALEASSVLDRKMSRLGQYTGLLRDQDTRASEPQGLRQELTKLGADVRAQLAFLSPEILRGTPETIDRFIASEPRLRAYAFMLHEMRRAAAHTLSESEEKLMSDAGPATGNGSGIYSIFANADLPYPTVTLSDGRSEKIDQAGYATYRASAVRADREKVMSAFFAAFGSFSRTFGMTMNSQAQRLLFITKARHYGSPLEASLYHANIPVAVYSGLIDGINRSLPSFHRYLKLRKRMMGVDQLHYYDLYAPLVESVDEKYSVEEAQKLVLGAVAVLGPEYTSVVQRAYDEHWIDFMPNTGKSAGAYSSSTYDVHPYMLLNYGGKYADVSTLAHELGHTMQSYLSNKAQPYATAGYPIFVAEVASIFNEALLNEYMLTRVTNDDTRLSMLGGYLENMKTTLFRQTQFAEFELRMHEMAQRGQPIVGDALAKLYLEITRKYYGHDRGICVVDDYIAHEWSFVPHFYQDFYVYQYATSFTASEALAEQVKAGAPAALKRYLAFISAGGSKHPIELLKDAGVDMTTSVPLDITIRSMNRVMDEMEAILVRKQR